MWNKIVKCISQICRIGVFFVSLTLCCKYDRQWIFLCKMLTKDESRKYESEWFIKKGTRNQGAGGGGGGCYTQPPLLKVVHPPCKATIKIVNMQNIPSIARTIEQYCKWPWIKMNTYSNLYLLIILHKKDEDPWASETWVTFPQKRGFAPLDLRVHPD